MPDPAFHAFSFEHFAALGVTALIALVMIFVARSGNRVATKTQEILLSAIILSQWPFSYWMHAQAGTLTADNSYPCHMCDVAGIFGVIALLTHRQIFVELVYFWGLAGTMQGLITPTLTLNWPHPRFTLFFIAHSGVVITALYGVIGLRKRPRAQAKWVCWGFLFVFAIVVGIFNWAMGSNYAFLCRKPLTASLYDLLGPWPWYIVSASLVGLMFFLLLDLPFIRSRRR